MQGRPEFNPLPETLNPVLEMNNSPEQNAVKQNCWCIKPAYPKRAYHPLCSICKFIYECYMAVVKEQVCRYVRKIIYSAGWTTYGEHFFLIGLCASTLNVYCNFVDFLMLCTPDWPYFNLTGTISIRMYVYKYFSIKD